MPSLTDYLPDAAMADVEHWEAELRRWNAKINLIAPSTVGDIRTRHSLDSAQIIPQIPDMAETIVDLGSGAGFPGLMLAIHAKHARPGQTVHMIESAKKKASFIRTIIRQLSLPAIIHSDRIEALEPLHADIITARAFAPLVRLFPLAERHLKPAEAGGGSLVLLKGTHVDEERLAVSDAWTYEHSRVTSVTDEAACVLTIRDLRRV